MVLSAWTEQKVEKLFSTRLLMNVIVPVCEVEVGVKRVYFPRAEIASANI